MLEELRWKTSVSATCLHVAACRARRLPAADARLAVALGPAADALAAELAAATWPVLPLLDELVGLASQVDNNRELVERAAARLHLPLIDPATASRVAGGVADLEAAASRSLPDLHDELAVRVRPLREQWEARGPGMLIELARLTDPAIVPAAAEIVLVSPYTGGAGASHPAYNRVTLEAMLFDPLPEAPETVRLAWHISQLNADLPLLADVLPPSRAAASVPLALVPPALSAAEAVELARCDEPTVAAVLAAWYGRPAPDGVAARVWTWWTAYLEHPTPWPVAVAALDEMLADLS